MILPYAPFPFIVEASNSSKISNGSTRTITEHHRQVPAILCTTLIAIFRIPGEYPGLSDTSEDDNSCTKRKDWSPGHLLKSAEHICPLCLLFGTPWLGENVPVRIPDVSDSPELPPNRPHVDEQRNGTLSYASRVSFPGNDITSSEIRCTSPRSSTQPTFAVLAGRAPSVGLRQRLRASQKYWGACRTSS